MERLDKLGGPGVRTTTTRSAGRTRWTRPINGPSRSPRTGAARATARSCTGRTASRRRAKSARSSTMSSMSRRRSSKPRGCPNRSRSTACSSARSRASACCTRSTTPSAAERHETQYFEMFGNRGIYHKGWTAVTKHGTPWDRRTKARAARRRRLGALRHEQGLDAGARSRRKQMPEKLHELQRLWLIEATRYNVLPMDDRTVEKFNPDIAGRPRADQGQHPIAVRRHGTPVRELRPQHQEQIPLCDGPNRGAEIRRRGRDHRPGRRTSAAGASTQRTASSNIATTSAGSEPLLRGSPRSRCPRASTRCGWSSPMPAAVLARAGR